MSSVSDKNSEHDDDFVTADVYADEIKAPTAGKCKAFFKKFLLLIITCGLIALLVMQIIWISAATNFTLCETAVGGLVMDGDVNCPAIPVIDVNVNVDPIVVPVVVPIVEPVVVPVVVPVVEPVVVKV